MWKRRTIRTSNVYQIKQKNIAKVFVRTTYEEHCISFWSLWYLLFKCKIVYTFKLNIKTTEYSFGDNIFLIVFRYFKLLTLHQLDFPIISNYDERCNLQPIATNDVTIRNNTSPNKIKTDAYVHYINIHLCTDLL